MGILGSILIMLFILSILVVVHEFGHYIAARIFNVRVEEFAIFMGPKIFSKVSKKTGTRWSIRSLPIGGFCALEGEEETVNSSTSFDSKPWYMRAGILLAGPFMNILLAIIIIISIFAFTGYETTVISQLSKGDYPANELGFEVGDRIISYDGKRVYTTVDYELFNSIDKDLTSVIGLKKKDGTVKTYTIERHITEENYKSPIGIQFSEEKGNFFQVIGNSVLYMVSLVRSIFYAIFWLITGQIGLDALASPVGMTTIVNDVVSAEKVGLVIKFLALLNMTALISANLGVFNLFIVPGLDGGKLLFIIIELLRGGKKVSPENEAKVSYIGIGLLLLFALIVMGNDILKIFR